MRPGAHLFIATSSVLAQFLYSALVGGGFEFRGQIIRLVRTLRGGDRPKNAEKEFPGITSTPRGCYEPWGLFRKPLLPKMRVSDCLREFQTGDLRQLADGKPSADVIVSERIPRIERQIAQHPSLKPQSFLRQLVYISLPLGEGVIADTLMGSGSTLAAAGATGVSSIGVDRHLEYYETARKAIPRLKGLRLCNVDTLVGISSQQLDIFPLATSSRLPPSCWWFRVLINPIALHLLIAARRDACCDCSAAPLDPCPCKTVAAALADACARRGAPGGFRMGTRKEISS
jgi:DNA methylase